MCQRFRHLHQTDHQAHAIKNIENGIAFCHVIHYERAKR